MATKTPPKCTEKLIICPYDKLHKVREDRLQYHLIKCKRQNLDKDYVICPFNPTHHMPKEEYEKHEEICQDKKILLRNTKSASPELDENCQFKDDENDPKEEVMNFLSKVRQKKAMKIIKEKEAAESAELDEFDREFFGPIGVMKDPNLPPGVKYSWGRGIFLHRKEPTEVGRPGGLCIGCEDPVHWAHPDLN